MTPDTFFEKFDLIADAPGAVGKMRELILTLAMRGELVEQDPGDAPASELLKEIEAEKKRISHGACQAAGMGTKARSKTKKLPPISDEAIPYAIPEGWEWVRFGEIAIHNAGKTLDSKRNTGTPRDYITTSNLYWGRFELGELRQMLIQEKEMERCTARKGDLLICEGGEAGRAAVWDFNHEVAFQNHVHRARFFGGIDPFYVYRKFEYMNFTDEISKYRKGVGISNMSGKALASIPIPLPPLAEQKRIVAKVDELMALCDRLEAEQRERETQHAALARASLARFADAPTPQNLQFLFHSSFNIQPSDLRKSILTLAVQGKLVEQDPGDEPAERLIELLEVERGCFAKASKFCSTSVTAHKLSFLKHDIPNSWVWCKLSALFNSITDGDHLPPPKADHGIAFLTIGNITTGNLEFDGCRFVPETYYQGLADFRQPIRGDILYTIVGATFGRPALVQTDRPFCVQRHIAILKPPKNIEIGYLMTLLRSPLVYEQATASTTGTAQPTVPLGALRNFAVPLPPLAEQKRIVDRVNELMALVDALETQLATSRSQAQKLLDALVAELN